MAEHHRAIGYTYSYSVFGHCWQSEPFAGRLGYPEPRVMEVRIKCVECICASTCHLKPSCAETQSVPQSSPARLGSGNGGRRRMSLEAASYDSARWRRCGVTVVWSSTLESRCHMYPARTSEQPCLGVALLSPNGEGNIKSFLK